jgi:hypothetical protein
MKNNYQKWIRHYDEILTDIYDRLCGFLESNREPTPSYDYFTLFVYENTEKFETQLSGFRARSLEAPIR